MREPDETTIARGDEKIINDHSFALKDITPAQKCWRAMIDAALKE